MGRVEARLTAKWVCCWLKGRGKHTAAKVRIKLEGNY